MLSIFFRYRQCSYSDDINFCCPFLFSKFLSMWNKSKYVIFVLLGLIIGIVITSVYENLEEYNIMAQDWLKSDEFRTEIDNMDELDELYKSLSKQELSDRMMQGHTFEEAKLYVEKFWLEEKIKIYENYVNSLSSTESNNDSYRDDSEKNKQVCEVMTEKVMASSTGKYLDRDTYYNDCILSQEMIQETIDIQSR